VNTRRWWQPSFGAAIWLILFLGLSLSDWRLALINGDGDPCLHWRIGHWMIEHHAVLREDVFSHTRPNAPLISKEWLSEVLFAAMGDALGWNGIVVLSAALIATYLWLLYRILLNEGVDLPLAMVFTLLAMLPCSVHWLARPHLFTHLFALVFTWQLRLFDRGKLVKRLLFLRLVPLMVLWVNLHGAFFTGLLIIFTFFVGNIISLFGSPPESRPVIHNKSKQLVLLGIACALATLLNPNGWKLPLHVIEFLRDPVLARYANEFRSPNFHTTGAHGFLITLALVAGTLIVLRQSWSATDITVTGTWGLLALLSARNVPIFALVVTPILTDHLQTTIARARTGLPVDFYHRFVSNLAALERSFRGQVMIAMTVAILVIAVALPKFGHSASPVATDIMTNRFPVAAIRFVAGNPHAIGGEMFNDYGWGGYLMLMMPDHKVFVDGRNDFYGPDLIHDFDIVNRIRPDWDAVLQKYKVGWTILPRDHALNILLSLHEDWSLAYTDDVAAIYVRKPK
jgi:hypothetical protein